MKDDKSITPGGTPVNKPFTEPGGPSVGHTMFSQFAAAGFCGDVIPIMPADAVISSNSAVGAENRGKVPGKYLGVGEWCGLAQWTQLPVSNQDIETWDTWPGAGVGIRTGHVVGVDIDVTDEALSLAIEQVALKELGPAPSRIGNPPKRLLPYQIEKPIKKTRDEYIHGDTGELHAVEILGDGQQFVAEGIHPKTGKPYTWERGDLVELGFDGLTEICQERLEAFRREVQAVMEGAGLTISKISSKGTSTTPKRLPIGDSSLLGDPTLVEKALGAVGNSLEYDEWIKFAVAIKAALGGNEDHYGIYENWCLKWPENTPDIARIKWDSFQDAGLGAQFLFDRARDAGCLLFGTGPVDSHGNPILSPSEPMRVADRFVGDCYTVDEARILHRHRGVFYLWNGQYYPEESDDGLRAHLYNYLDKAKKRTGKGTLVPFNPAQAVINRVIDALKAVVHLPDDTSAPVWLDGREIPAASDVLICGNGLLDYPTRKLHPHNPALFAHRGLEFAYENSAPKPKEFLKFLNSVWKHDPETISSLQEVMGYLVSGSTSLQKIIILVGPKRSGKGTLARVIEKLLGTTNVCSPTLGSFSSGFPLQPLLGKTLAIISDARLGHRTDQKAITENLLRISGEDSVNVNRKFLTDWSGYLPTRFLIITNELPRLADASGALASRFHPLVMTKSFFGKEDLNLSSRLLEELPGILNWSLDGWDNLKARRYFAIPASSKSSMAELEELSSPVTAFINEECNVGLKQSISVDMLYLRWQEWSRAEGRTYSVPKANFGRDLHAVLPEIKITRPRRKAGTRLRMYEGIGLKPSKAEELGKLSVHEGNIFKLPRGKRGRRT
jgi:putative DNA primase/helicase